MPVCRECFLYQTQEQEKKQAELGTKSLTHEVVFNGEDEKVDDDDSKLIVSVQKSQQSQGSTSTQTNSGEQTQQNTTETTVEPAATDLTSGVGAVPFSQADEPDSLLIENKWEQIDFHYMIRTSKALQTKKRLANKSSLRTTNDTWMEEKLSWKPQLMELLCVWTIEKK